MLVTHEQHYYNSVHRHDDRFVKHGNLMQTEVNRILRLLDIHNSISVWIPILAHACVLFITLLLYISDSELEDSSMKTYWKMFINASGLGRSLPLLSDSSPVSFLEKLKILFATWPTSSNCQLLQMRYQTEAYKIRIGLSSTKQLFYTFQYNISPRAFPALNKTT